MSLDWGHVDGHLDQIIDFAANLKGNVGSVKAIVSKALEEKEASVKRVHGDLEALQKQLENTSFAHKEERDKLERAIEQKEAEQKAKLAEYDQKVQAEFDARERAEREREAAQGNAEAEKKRLTQLLKDLEDDASGVQQVASLEALVD